MPKCSSYTHDKFLTTSHNISCNYLKKNRSCGLINWKNSFDYFVHK